MSKRTSSCPSSCAGCLLIVLIIAAIFVYRAGLMPPPVAQFLDPIGKQLEAIANQLEAFAKSFLGITQSPTPAAQP